MLRGSLCCTLVATRCKSRFCPEAGLRAPRLILHCGCFSWDGWALRFARAPECHFSCLGAGRATWLTIPEGPLGGRASYR